jgi:predicted flap endonuclease-1-like 5' DNA nuclease
MGDEKDPSAPPASDVVTSAPALAPVSVVPKPVSLPPRPLGNAAPTSRMPPPPSSRGILPSAPPAGSLRSPPPPPQRYPTPPPGPSSVVASPSVVPRAPATPPPPPQRTSVPPSFSRPLTHAPSAGLTAQLEQRLGATQIELRKLGSERHTWRARLRREADRLRELESALRAEKELRAQASEENFAAIIGLRSRLAEVEAAREDDTARLRTELEQARRELEAARAEVVRTHGQLEAARAELAQTRGDLDAARGVLEETRSPSSSDGDARAAARANKAPQGLRRIRGIGPAYQRVLEQAGITRVQQIAKWTTADVLTFADKLKIRPDRITKDAWISQAQSLDPDPEE